MFTKDEDSKHSSPEHELNLYGSTITHRERFMRNPFQRQRNSFASYTVKRDRCFLGHIDRKTHHKTDRLQVNINIKMHNIFKMRFMNDTPTRLRTGGSRILQTIDVQGLPLQFEPGRIHQEPVTPRLTIRHSNVEPREASYSPQSAFIANRCRCGQCDQCCRRSFSNFLRMVSPDNQLPKVSARSWTLWKKVNNRFVYIHGKRPHKQRQVASLSKLVVALVVQQRLERWKIDADKVLCRVPERLSRVSGTSANLQPGEILSVKDLLYALLLPSGNDAAVLLSYLFGMIMGMQREKKLASYGLYKEDLLSGDLAKAFSSQVHQKLFVVAMNDKAKALGTSTTEFYNPHGNDAFEAEPNLSTALQIARVCFTVLDNQSLKTIVNTKNYRRWSNTNRLLWEGFHGIKTGTNESAGACLAAIYQNILVVVLNCRTDEDRWSEAKQLVRWATHRS